MTPAVWIAIILAVIIVSSAVGIPYWLTHRRMTDHYEHDRSETYLSATGRTAGDVARKRPGRAWRRRPPGRHQAAASGGSAVADRPTETETL
jgi:hypothetical protein